MVKTSKTPEGAQANTAPQQTDRHIATVQLMFIRPDEPTDALRALLTKEQADVLDFANMYKLSSEAVQLLGEIAESKPARVANLIERMLFHHLASGDFDGADEPELLGDIYSVMDLLKRLSGIPVED